MSNRALLFDLVLAGVLVALVLVLSPGLAIVAIIAILALVVCAASLGVGRLRSRRPRRRRS